jgi:KaiC/GvpD/RAD55 family RecA-like ATPase
MSKLKAVKPKKAEPKKPKILIYGKPGVGKTWQALDFPSVYYIDTEGGADLAHYTDKLERSGGVYLGPDQGSLDFATVLEQVQALATERHDFRTLVIDSISKLYTLEITR